MVLVLKNLLHRPVFCGNSDDFKFEKPLESLLRKITKCFKGLGNYMGKNHAYLFINTIIELIVNRCLFENFSKRAHHG